MVAEIVAALADGRSWERFVELRMGAGPTVRIGSDGSVGLRVSVTWGSQRAEVVVQDATSAVEAADRLALVLYQVRRDLPVADR